MFRVPALFRVMISDETDIATDPLWLHGNVHAK
jgi:hypothetical protein